MKNVEPLDDRVLILPTDAAKKTKGGIFLPDNAREKPSEGTVVSVGPGKRGDDGERRKVAVQPGDVVVYSKYAGTEIVVDEVKHVVIRETDLIVKITEVPEPATAQA